jgi:hypothetical protein
MEPLDEMGVGVQSLRYSADLVSLSRPVHSPREHVSNMNLSVTCEMRERSRILCCLFLAGLASRHDANVAVVGGVM